MLKGDAASHYAARRLQLAAAGSSPKALLAAVVTTAHIRLLKKMVMLVFHGWPVESIGTGMCFVTMVPRFCSSAWGREGGYGNRIEAPRCWLGLG